MFDFDLLYKLTSASAPSSNEAQVRNIITSRLNELGIPASVSPDGSVAAVIKSNSQATGKLMLQAHTDEVGFMVKSHTDGGFLKLAPLGIRDSRLLTGRRVTVAGKNGPLSGFIGAIPIHLSKSGKKIPAYSDLYVDIGAESKEEAEAIAPIGSFGCFEANFETFGSDGKFIKSKALSGRTACAVLLETARYFTENSIPLPYDLYFAFSPRGKVSLSGGSALYSRICPDAVISLTAFEISRDSSISSVSGAALPLTEEKYALDASLTAQLRNAFNVAGKLHETAPVPASVECEYDIIRLKSAGARVSALKLPVKNRNTVSELMSCDVINGICETLVSVLPHIKI